MTPFGPANQRFKHGLTRSPAWNAWNAMRRRCLKPVYENFKHYGGRGITICDRWQEFSAFLADMGQPPSPAHSLEREDNDGNYEPGNCRWATGKEQCNNRRNNVLLTIGGETKTVAEWADASGIKYATIYMRIKRGRPPEAILGGLVNGHGAPL